MYHADDVRNSCGGSIQEQQLDRTLVGGGRAPTAGNMETSYRWTSDSYSIYSSNNYSIYSSNN